MNQSLLGQVGLSHSPVIDRHRAVVAPRSAVFPRVLGAALDGVASRADVERALLRALAKVSRLDCRLLMRPPSLAPRVLPR